MRRQAKRCVGADLVAACNPTRLARRLVSVQLYRRRRHASIDDDDGDGDGQGGGITGADAQGRCDDDSDDYSDDYSDDGDDGDNNGDAGERDSAVSEQRRRGARGARLRTAGQPFDVALSSI